MSYRKADRYVASESTTIWAQVAPSGPADTSIWSPNSADRRRVTVVGRGFRNANQLMVPGRTISLLRRGRAAVLGSDNLADYAFQGARSEATMHDNEDPGPDQTKEGEQKDE